MKILHVPFTFHPDPVGGTEVYVDALAHQQLSDGMDVGVAAPGSQQQHYRHGRVAVWRFPVAERVDDVRELYGEGDAVARAAFAKILEAERPDVVHLHAFTRGVSLRLVREAKKRGLGVVFTYHTPTVSCQRGTLMRWGSEPCNGLLDVTTCTQCSLHGLGLNRVLSTVAGWMPSSGGRLVGSYGLSGGMWTAIRMTELVSLRHAAVRSLMKEVDHIVAMCDWVKAVLVRNGVPEENITVSRQGLRNVERCFRAAFRIRGAGLPLKMMFIGRMDPTKGLGLLLEALRPVPDLAITLDVYGIAQGDSGAAYLASLQRIAKGDDRVVFRGSIPVGDVVEQMGRYDVIAVPSQGLETGPLVVMEAFAAGVPVLGANVGGIAELVSHGGDGFLVEPCSVGAWRIALEKLSGDRELVERLRTGIGRPRSMADVAEDMSTLYSQLFGHSGHTHEPDFVAASIGSR